MILTLTSHVLLGKSLNLSGPYFHLQNGHISFCFTEFSVNLRNN